MSKIIQISDNFQISMPVFDMKDLPTRRISLLNNDGGYTLNQIEITNPLVHIEQDGTLLPFVSRNKKTPVAENFDYIIVEIPNKQYKYRNGYKSLIVNQSHLYAYNKNLSMKFNVSSENINKTKSLQPHRYRFQLGNPTALFVIDTSRELLFALTTEEYKNMQPTGNTETRLKTIYEKIQYQKYYGKILPIRINRFEISNSKVLYMGYTLGSRSLIKKLLNAKNVVYVTTSGFIPNGNIPKMEYAEWILSNQKRKIAIVKTITSNTEHKDHLLKTIELLRIYKAIGLEFDEDGKTIQQLVDEKKLEKAEEEEEKIEI